MHALLLLAAICADPDIEAMKRSLEAQIGVLQRLNSLEARVTNLEQKGGDLPSAVNVPPAVVGSVVVTPEVPATESPETAVCKCLGYKGRAYCFCLQRGVACRCNRSTGSVWNMENGRPVNKTGAYADPRRESQPARSHAPAASASSGYAVTSSGGVAYWTDSSGVNWNDVGTGLREGVVYGGRFTYRNGAMHENGSKMAADIAPKGHWAMQRLCVNGVCQMYRVWVNE